VLIELQPETGKILFQRDIVAPKLSIAADRMLSVTARRLEALGSKSYNGYKDCKACKAYKGYVLAPLSRPAEGGASA
jgi:hypothetical protein